jgi:hypothetical protein
MTKHLWRSLASLTMLAGLAAAAQVNGVLMDKMCSMKAVKDGQTAATAHTRECALMPPCQKSGYGVYTTDNKFLTFDDAGNAKALTALNASKKKDNLKVRVTGDVQGDTIKVANLKLQ